MYIDTIQATRASNKSNKVYSTPLDKAKGNCRTSVRRLTKREASWSAKTDVIKESGRSVVYKGEDKGGMELRCGDFVYEYVIGVVRKVGKVVAPSSQHDEDEIGILLPANPLQPVSESERQVLVGALDVSSMQYSQRLENIR